MRILKGVSIGVVLGLAGFVVVLVGTRPDPAPRRDSAVAGSDRGATRSSPLDGAEPVPQSPRPGTHPGPTSNASTRDGAESGGEESEMNRVRTTLAEVIEARLPDLKLSDVELDALADATIRMRDARARLRALPKTRENADRREREAMRLADAVGDFSYVAEMTPEEFTRRVDREGGIDAWSPDQHPGDVDIRPIRPDEAIP